MVTEAEIEEMFREIRDLQARADAYLARAPRVRSDLSAVLASLDRLSGRPTLRLVRSADPDQTV